MEHKSLAADCDATKESSSVSSSLWVEMDSSLVSNASKYPAPHSVHLICSLETLSCTSISEKFVGGAAEEEFTGWGEGRCVF